MPPGEAAVGLCLGRAGHPPLLRAGVPVSASDATRTEAMGPPLACLFLAALAPRARGRLVLTGDSAAVVDLLNRCSSPADLFLFNIRELVRDVLRGWGYRAHWVPRTQNAECDALANSARTSRNVTLTASPAVPAAVLDAWNQLAIEFTRRFSVGGHFSIGPSR